MQNAIRQVIYEYYDELPRALSVAEKVLEDQISVLKDAYRKESVTASTKSVSLEFKVSNQDN